ncbi:MAG: hypothetical protein Q8S84_05900 [bacterium]|nr:hypothetical protein [bacterium]MDP3381012.1 hypothetical protein [bacterium]
MKSSIFTCINSLYATTFHRFASIQSTNCFCISIEVFIDSYD